MVTINLVLDISVSALNDFLNSIKLHSSLEVYNHFRFLLTSPPSQEDIVIGTLDDRRYSSDYFTGNFTVLKAISVFTHTLESESLNSDYAVLLFGLIRRVTHFKGEGASTITLMAVKGDECLSTIINTSMRVEDWGSDSERLTRTPLMETKKILDPDFIVPEILSYSIINTKRTGSNTMIETPNHLKKVNYSEVEEVRIFIAHRDDNCDKRSLSGAYQIASFRYGEPHED